MKKTSISLASLIGGSFLIMGLSMPSCPGQEALQQSVEALKTSNSELKAKLGAQDAAMKGLKDELGQLTAKLTEVTTAVLAQKTALEEMDKTVKAMQAPKGKSATKAAPKKR